MKQFEVGDLVRDILNEGTSTYGLGVVVRHTNGLSYNENSRPYEADQDIEGPRYDVYFNKFERVVTFHGDYLEKV